MSNPHYNAGRRFEYKIMKVLKENFPPEKYTIIRTAGSHSPVDVILIEHLGDKGPKRSFGVQCKTKKGKYTTEGEIKALQKEYGGLSHVPEN